MLRPLLSKKVVLYLCINPRIYETKKNTRNIGIEFTGQRGRDGMHSI